MSRFLPVVKNLIPGTVLSISVLLTSVAPAGSSAHADNPACGITSANYNNRIFHGFASLGPYAMPMKVTFSNGKANTTVLIRVENGQPVYHRSEGPYRVTAGHIEWDAQDPVAPTPIPLKYSSRDRACDGTVAGNPTEIEGLIEPLLGEIYDSFSLWRELPND